MNSHLLYRKNLPLNFLIGAGLRICSTVFLTTLFLVAQSGLVSAQSPPTGLISANRLGNGSGNQATLNNALSVNADGRYVAFVSEATDLALNDTNNSSDVFVRDRQTGQTILVSVNSAGTGPADQYSNAPTISPDGRYVAFVSAASNLVTDDAATLIHEDIFVRDLQSGTTTLVSRNFAGTARGNGASGFFDPLGISADGRFVVFTSFATDLVAAPDNNNQTDVFVRDLQTRTTTLISANRNGTGPGNNVSSGAVITPSGRFVAFLSQARDLVVLDPGFRRQVYVRDFQTNTTKLVTINRLGTSGANADTDFRVERGLTVSFDGRFVAFVSEASDLVDNDSNGVSQDVFVRDTQTDVTLLVSVNSGGSTSGNGGSGQIAMTPDGHFVAFLSSADDLVANDSDQQQDVFVRNLQANSTTLISVNRTGSAGGNGSSASSLFFAIQRPSISDDARYVSFTSSATDLTPGNDTNGGNPGGSLPDVFVRDRQSGVTTLASLKNDGSDSGNGTSATSALAHDGKSIFYFSGASDLVGYDSNAGVQDLFVFELMPQAGEVRFQTAVTSAPENSGTATVVVTLLGPLASPVVISFSSSNGTAIAGTDYVAASGTVAFSPGETQKTFDVSLLNDSLDENDETVVLRLVSINANVPLGEPNFAVVKIVDDDPLRELRINDVTIGEFEQAIFTISLSAPSGRSVGVQFTSQGGTATPSVDFSALSGALSFSPGQTVKLISIPTKTDTLVESVENFFVNLTNPTNALISDSQGEASIVDDDTLILLTEPNSDRAIAFDSVLLTRDPFAITNTLNFSVDQRTRISLFAVGLRFLSGGNASSVSATAEDSQGTVRPLTVEFLGDVYTGRWLMQLVLKLDEPVATAADLRVKIVVQGVTSNTVRIGVQP